MKGYRIPSSVKAETVHQAKQATPTIIINTRLGIIILLLDERLIRICIAPEPQRVLFLSILFIIFIFLIYRGTGGRAYLLLLIILVLDTTLRALYQIS